MPSNEESCRHQFAVMWTPNGHNMQGDKQINAGTELGVRWEDAPSNPRNSKGDEEEFDARIMVNQDVTLGSIFWQGQTSDLPTPVTDVSNLYEVVEFIKTPDVKGRNFRRVCLLKKWSDTLPTIS